MRKIVLVIAAFTVSLSALCAADTVKIVDYSGEYKLLDKSAKMAPALIRSTIEGIMLFTANNKVLGNPVLSIERTDRYYFDEIRSTSITVGTIQKAKNDFKVGFLFYNESFKGEQYAVVVDAKNISIYSNDTIVKIVAGPFSLANQQTFSCAIKNNVITATFAGKSVSYQVPKNMPINQLMLFADKEGIYFKSFKLTDATTSYAESFVFTDIKRYGFSSGVPVTVQPEEIKGGSDNPMEP